MLVHITYAHKLCIYWWSDSSTKIGAKYHLPGKQSTTIYLFLNLMDIYQFIILVPSVFYFPDYKSKSTCRVNVID